MKTKSKASIPARLTVLGEADKPVVALPPPEPVDAAYEEIKPNTYAEIIAGFGRDMARLATRVLGRP